MAYIRNNANIVKGDQLWLFITKTITTDGTTTSVGDAKPIAFATNCSLNRSMNTTSVSSKDHGNTSYLIPGEGSWTASTEALYAISVDSGATGFDDLMAIFDNHELVNVKFGYVADGGTNIVDVDGAQNWTITSGWSGQGYLTSLQASGSHGETSSWSAEIAGVGVLSAIPAPTPTPTQTQNPE